MTKKKDTKQPAYACNDTIGYLKVMLLSKPSLMSLEKFRVKFDLRTMKNMIESQAITLKITRLNS
ncbi:hypothetical protein DVH24_031778 [Malus domestica]|uniref:Uncharacterized protein n=1 Tax=Malus domestica TaxID=3750 RepID=A0A498J7N7_MALDO|nr:hypothetical protein DVH24_031778 [Malus domestica]